MNDEDRKLLEDFVKEFRYDYTSLAQAIENLLKENAYLRKNSVPVAKIEETFDNYINPLLEELDEDRRWCDIELVDNFEALKKDLLKECDNK